MKRWYVAGTHVRSEQKAALHLCNQGFEVYVPVIAKTRRHARRVDTVKSPMFPRYVFIAFDVELQPWRSINGTVGIGHLIVQGERPVAVPLGVVEEIQMRESEDGFVKLAMPAIKHGEKVRILVGAMSDHVAIFDEMADDQRVYLLLNIMGRQVRIKAPLENIAVAS